MSRSVSTKMHWRGCNRDRIYHGESEACVYNYVGQHEARPGTRGAIVIDRAASGAYHIYIYITGRGNGLAVEAMSQNPMGPGSIPRLGSRRSSLISIACACSA